MINSILLISYLFKMWSYFVGGDVSIDDGVDTQACDAASGVTTSVTTGNSPATVLRGKRHLRGDSTSSPDFPLTFLRLVAALGMIFLVGDDMLFRSIFFVFLCCVVFVMCEYYL